MAGQYPDIPYDGPPRSYNSTSYAKRYVAIHNTSNDASAEGEASYAKRRTDSVSSHYYVDSDSIVQSLHTDLGASHAGSGTGNRHAISYEITGVNGWTRPQWLANVQWALLARQIARDCKRHGIAVQLLTVAQMQDGRTTGVVTHDLMRRAWGGTTHTDPGANFPMDHLLALVRAELGGTVMPDPNYGGWPTPPAAGNRTGDLMTAELWTEEQYGQGAYGTPARPDKSHRQLQLDRIEAALKAIPTAEQIAAAVIKLLPPSAGGAAPTAEEIADAVVDEQVERLSN